MAERNDADYAHKAVSKPIALSPSGRERAAAEFRALGWIEAARIVEAA